MLNGDFLNELELIELTQEARKLTYKEPSNQKQILQKRSERAFRQLLETYYGLIRNLVNLYSTKTEKNFQKDLEQEAIIAFYQAVIDFDKSRNVKLSTWVFYQIRAKLKAISQQLKKQGKALERLEINLENFSLSVRVENEKEIQLKQLSLVLCQLTKIQQQIVKLQLNGWKWETIAKTLKSTPDAVRMIWNRAVKRLRQLLTKQSKN